MHIIKNKFIPFKGYKAMNLFGIIFFREECDIDAASLNHEAIHTEQMKEMLYIPFYIWYIIEYLIRLIVLRDFKKAYRFIGFEQEAYDHEFERNYLKERKHFTWWDYYKFGS
jgi:hypothetical protein